MEYEERESEIAGIRSYCHLTVPKGEGVDKHIVSPDNSIRLVFQFRKHPEHNFIKVLTIANAEMYLPIFDDSNAIAVSFYSGFFYKAFNLKKKLLPCQYIDVSDLIPEFSKKLEQLMTKLTKENYSTILDLAFVEMFNLKLEESLELKIAKLIVGKNGVISNKLLSEEFRLSERQIQRRFKEYFGVSLKEFRSIEQLRAAFFEIGIGIKSFSKIALDNGYFDQQHLNLKLKKIIGQKPKNTREYLSRVYFDMLKL